MRKMRSRKNRNSHHSSGAMRPHRKAPTHYYPARIRHESSEQELAKEHGREAAQQRHRVRRQHLELANEVITVGPDVGEG
ncbi:MAG: hypothetical protein DLM69_04535 [Candidatus Chloroheliales bacterium]|nr:MAG: hypothetical protein DLM69_04535 [Chloroflexota bacterium]